VSCRTQAYHGVFLPAGGGIVRIHTSGGTRGGNCFEDLGYKISIGETKLGTAGYDATRPLEVLGPGEFRCELSFSASAFFFPGLISRTILRVLGKIPGAHRWLRRGIDFYRQRRKTAVNQSAAPIAHGRAIVRCERRVDFGSAGAVVIDVIRTSDREVDLRKLSPIGSRNGSQQELQESWNEARRAIEATRLPLKAIRVVKRAHDLMLPAQITIQVLE